MERHLFQPSINKPHLCKICDFDQTSTMDGLAMIPIHTNPDAKMEIYHGPFPPPKQDGNDPINPSHYSFTTMSAVAVSEEWGLNFRLFSVLKYIQRHERKGDPLENLKKAQWYLNREITRRENEPPRS